MKQECKDKLWGATNSVATPVEMRRGFILRWYLVPFNGLSLQIAMTCALPSSWPDPPLGVADLPIGHGYCYRADSTIFCWVHIPGVDSLTIYTLRDYIATLNHELLHAVLDLAEDVTHDPRLVEEPMAYVISYADRAAYDVMLIAMTGGHPEFHSLHEAAEWWGAQVMWEGDPPIACPDETNSRLS